MEARKDVFDFSFQQSEIVLGYFDAREEAVEL